MLLHHICRLLCLFLLGVNVAAAVIKPSSIVQADGYQPDSQLPTPPPMVVDSSVRSISHSEPPTPPRAEQIYDEHDLIPDLKDADRANWMVSHRAYENSRTTDSVLDFEPDYWPLFMMCACITVVSCIVKVAREFTR